jgi:hypothetical protein
MFTTKNSNVTFAPASTYTETEAPCAPKLALVQVSDYRALISVTIPNVPDNAIPRPPANWSRICLKIFTGMPRPKKAHGSAALKCASRAST